MNKLGLEAGDKLLVMGDKDVVILKTIPPLCIGEFDGLIKEKRKQAKATGMKRSDITDARAESRGQR
ncbi:hypothetical protein M1N93_02130 [Dehalococcoidia bacterium]|nr:hypothetical protein [Dehalococcoidia bacterium]